MAGRVLLVFGGAGAVPAQDPGERAKAAIGDDAVPALEAAIGVNE
jgi:hypothetical protein